MRRWQLAILAALNALAGVLLAVAVNFATNRLPPFLEEHPAWSWTLVAILGLATVGCAVLLARGDQPAGPQPTSGSVRVGGVHVGRDLTIRGEGNTVTGGDQHPPSAGSLGPPLRLSRRRQRF
jgi:hypothetical protein